MVILNKTDLLEGGEHAAVAAELKTRVRAGTRLVPTRHGEIDVAALLGVGASAEDDLHNRQSHHEMEGEEQHDHDDFVTFIVSLGEVADKAAMLKRIEQTIAAHDVLRIKGFVDVTGSPARLLVQAVGPRLNSYFDRPWKTGERRGTELVVIGEKHMDREAITGLLRG
jgi:cobalamin biosynthesis protein CobW